MDYEETGLSPDEVEEMRESFIPPEEKEAIDRAYADMCRELDACKRELTKQGALCPQKEPKEKQDG